MFWIDQTFAVGSTNNLDTTVFKQQTAYEMVDGLVGSEMCIRDSCYRKLRERCWRSGMIWAMNYSSGE